MGAYTCQFGVVHKRCRCREPHTIRCDVPDEHGLSTVDISLNGQTFTRVGTLTQGGKTLEETFFATDKSNLKVTIDYRYTEKGCK